MDLAVRVGLGYVNGVRDDEMKTLVGERERGGAYTGMDDLASRSGVSRDGLERLAWAGACASLGVEARASVPKRRDRRRDLWRAGVAKAARARLEQLSLPLPLPETPRLPELDAWETIVADYASTGMSLADHPMGLIRPQLSTGLARSDDLQRIPDSSRVELAGMVVARQRPSTAKGVVFMLLEDEVGVINLVVLPPAYERHRLAVRTAGFVRVTGQLERREGVINVVVDTLEALATPDVPQGKVRHIESPAERETGRREYDEEQELPKVAAGAGGVRSAAAEIAAVAPHPHSFGRRQ
jgi:error-prone DNA polymerase